MRKLIKVAFIMSLVLGFVSCNPAGPIETKYQVILDKNNNWQRDANESGLKDVSITLIDDSGQTLEQAVSDTQGYVSFKQNLEGKVLLFGTTVPDDQVLRCQPFSDYSVCQILPAFVVSKTGDITRFSTLINDAKDDAEETKALVNLYSGQLKLEQDNLVGLRFGNILIPPDALITKAYLTFTTQDNHSTDATFTITANLVTNSPSFTTAQKNLSSRPKTTNQMSWTVPAWVENKKNASPNLHQIVQEVIEQPSWQSGQAMSFMISSSGLRIAKSFEKSSALAPELVIEYQIPPAPNNPSSFTALASSPSQVDLSWEDVVTAGSYTLERKPYGGSYTKVASTPTPEYTDTTVSPDTFYSYRLTAVNGGGSE